MVSNEGKITGHISKCYLWNKHKDGSLKFWNEIHGYYGPVGKQKYNSGHDTFTESLMHFLSKIKLLVQSQKQRFEP